MIKSLVVLIESGLSESVENIIKKSLFSTCKTLNFAFDFVYFGQNYPILSNDYKFKNYLRVKIDPNTISSVELSYIIAEFIKQNGYEFILLPSFPVLKFYSSIAGALAAKTDFNFANEVFEIEQKSGSIYAKRPSLNGILTQKFAFPLIIGISYLKTSSDILFEQKFNEQIEVRDITLDSLGFGKQLIDMKNYEKLHIKPFESSEIRKISTSEELLEWFS